MNSYSEYIKKSFNSIIKNKQGKDLSGHFTKEDRQMVSKRMKTQNLGARYAVAAVIPLFTPLWTELRIIFFLKS